MGGEGTRPAGRLEVLDGGRYSVKSADVAALRRLLSAARLVTVTGAPGTWRDDLAAAAVTAVAADFPDGTWTVPLADVPGGTLVAGAVARSLQLPDVAGQSQLGVVRDELSSKRLLIVLANCDRLAGACAALTAELAGCRGVHLLATASAPLRAPGERVYLAEYLQQR